MNVMIVLFGHVGWKVGDGASVSKQLLRQSQLLPCLQDHLNAGPIRPRRRLIEHNLAIV